MTTTVSRRILDVVVPAVARWMVALMRRLEEASTDSDTRWELLRQQLEQYAHRSERRSP